MTPAQILALIASTIYSNGVGAITGPNLATILNAIVGLFSSVVPASTIITASTAYVITVAQYRLGFLRTLNLAAMSATLPTGATSGQEFILQDLAGNFSTYPVTVYPSAGSTFSGGRTSYVMNEDNQTARFAFYGSVWGVEPA